MRRAQHRRPLIAAAAILLVAGSAACTGGEDPSPTATLEPAPSGQVSDGGGQPAATESPSAPGKCTVKEGDEALPSEAPAVDSWEDVSGVGIPTSDTYGPYVQDGELWTCYEHSPTGALFAATYVFAAMGQVSGFADAWVPEGDFRELVAEQEQASPAATDGTLTPAAYRFVSYTDDKAIVDVVTEFSNSDGSANLSMRFALQWSGDRWMVDAEDSSKEFTPLDSLDGYTQWGTNG